MEIKKNYINGKWVESETGRTLDILNPATGEVIGVVTHSSAVDAERAIQAAKTAFYQTREWRDMDAQTRADILLKIADLMEARADELARTDTLDNGKPLRESEGDISDAIHCYRYYAGLVGAPEGSTYQVNQGFGKMHSYEVREPIGVVAQITPWNYPLLMTAWKLAPALAAGNCVVFKPSDLSPLSTVMQFEIFEQAGLPAGTANLVLGSGTEVGVAFSSSMDVDMITFTGSTAVGQDIMKRAACNVKKIGLELGGKSPLVIFADCNLDAAVEWAMIGFLFNQGEVCSAVARMYVENSVKDEFVKKLVAKMEAMTIGNGLENPDIGPVITEKDMNRILGMIETAKSEGAKVLTGGYRYTEGDCAKGYFIKPTLLDCKQGMTPVREEIFGPVGTIVGFDTEAEAIALANDTEYGLAGAVFTENGAKALRVTTELRAGITWVNCCEPTFNQAPWGGYKMSGIGRELGVHGMEEYQETKQINIALEPGAPGWYVNG